MPEININQTTSQKDKVYFRGAANLSDKEAESYQATTDAAKAETVKATETVKTAEAGSEAKTVTKRGR